MIIMIEKITAGVNENVAQLGALSSGIFHTFCMVSSVKVKNHKKTYP